MKTEIDELKSIFFQLHKRYGVLISIGVNNVHTTIKYEVEIQFLDRNKSNNCIIQVDRVSEVFVNDKSPDYLIEDLSYETGKVFYPIQIEVDKTGGFLSIHNVEIIQSRWINVKEQVQRYFVGEQVDKYLQEMDRVIANPSKLNDTIKYDLFFNTYFVPIYRSYAFVNAIEKETTLLMNAIPLKYSTKWILSKSLTDFGTKKLTCTGKEADAERQIGFIDYQQILSENSDDNYKANYFLSEENDLISEISLNWSINFIDKKNIMVNIYEIEDIWAKEHPKKDKTKKKGFFSFLSE